MDHDTPFHRSITVWKSRMSSTHAAPTATHDVELVQDTPFRMLTLPGTFGVGCTAHADPSQDSTSVCGSMPTVVEPAATHRVAPVHDTPRRSFRYVLGLAVG